MANDSQQLLARLQQRLGSLGITDRLTVSPNNTIVFATGPHAGQEVDTLNLLGVGSGGRAPEADVYSGDGQNMQMTALSGPNAGQTRAAPSGMTWKDWATTLGFLAAPFAAPAIAGGVLGPSAFGSSAAGADASLPAVDTMSSAGTPAMAGTTAGASAIPGLTSATSALAPKLAKLATGGLGIGLNLASRNPAQQQNAPLMAALNALLPQMQQRFQQTQPLFGNVVNMAHGMLPKEYQ